MSSLGSILQKKRESKNYSTYDVVNMIHIHQEYIQALEEDDYQAIPGGEAYVIGYLRQYAKFLNLEEKEIINLYRKSQGEKEKSDIIKESVITGSRPDSEQFRLSPPKFILALSFVASIAIYFTLSGLFHEKPNFLFLNRYIEDAKNEDANNKITDLEEQKKEKELTQSLSDAEHKIIFVAKDSTYLQVRNNFGELLLEKKLDNGESYLLNYESNLKISAEKPSSIDVYVERDTEKLYLGSIEEISKKQNYINSEVLLLSLKP